MQQRQLRFELRSYNMYEDGLCLLYSMFKPVEKFSGTSLFFFGSYSIIFLIVNIAENYQKI